MWKFLLSKGCWLSKKGLKTHRESLIIHFGRGWARSGKIFENELPVLHWWKGIWLCSLVFFFFPLESVENETSSKLPKVDYLKISYPKFQVQDFTTVHLFFPLGCLAFYLLRNSNHWVDMWFFVILGLSLIFQFLAHKVLGRQYRMCFNSKC